LRDPKSFAATNTFPLKAPWMVSTLAWSPDGSLLVVGNLDDGTLSKGSFQVVDASSLSVVATLDTGGAAATRVTCSWQGHRVVAVVGRDVRAWSIAPK
jgi:WD40 repeat protein